MLIFFSRYYARLRYFRRWPPFLSPDTLHYAVTPPRHVCFTPPLRHAMPSIFRHAADAAIRFAIR